MTNDEIPNDERNPNDEIPIRRGGLNRLPFGAVRHGESACLTDSPAGFRRMASRLAATTTGHSDFVIRASLGIWVLRHSSFRYGIGLLAAMLGLTFHPRARFGNSAPAVNISRPILAI